MQVEVESRVSEGGTAAPNWNKEGMLGHVFSALIQVEGGTKGVYMKDSLRNSLEENSD